MGIDNYSRTRRMQASLDFRSCVFLKPYHLTSKLFTIFIAYGSPRVHMEERQGGLTYPSQQQTAKMAKQFSKHREYCKIAIGEPEVVDLMKEVPCSFSAASLELLNEYGSRMKRLDGIEQHYSIVTSDQELSTVEIMKLATARYASFLTQSSGDRFMLTHPFNGNHTALSREVTDDLELALFLLVSAEKVANEQFDRAWELLRMCIHLASPTGDPVQRVVYYFAEALQERIKRKTGIVSSDGWECNKRWQSRLEEEITCLLPSSFAHRQELPFYSATQFSGIQAILESMASAKRIHLVDLGIRSGSHWTILMQALAVRHECPLESLKVTAIGTTSRQLVEETGRRLSSFSDTLSIPFSFEVVMVSDMQDLSEHLFEVEADEAVGVYSSLSLMNFIARPSHLEALMGVIKTICPIVMVVTEVEANTNSPAFMDRFVQLLLHNSAYFDSFEDSMNRCNPNRMKLEADYFRGGIQNVLTFEAEERTIVNMTIDGWRNTLKRYGLVETELSMSSRYQADLVVKKFNCGSSCTLGMDGKCLLVGWKGTPIFSLSAWKFHPEKGE